MAYSKARRGVGGVVMDVTVGRTPDPGVRCPRRRSRPYSCAVEWWRWVAAAVQAVLLLVLVLLWWDTLRDRRGWTSGRAARTAAAGSVVIPVGVVPVLLTPPVVVLVLLAVPAVAVAVMALAS
ncbi:hypothetical protein GCM10011594_27130 [Nakamurella endophytica]|uniref:Uncharacterized protein n=1 Tax=Nakamurella endophytica TaxID=1748367 RepID=A0A917T031_9ACTN|nr:hypothetical protein GCM10011594_27130 [Nakamurella endophytica]